jgi:hypothetical protein
MTMNARPVDVANAAVVLLNKSQSSFAIEFQATRAYRPVYDLTKFSTGLVVTVIPSELEETPFSRQTIQSLVTVDVAVQKKVSASSEVADCDQLMLLVEQIKSVMEAGLTLAEAKIDCGWQQTQNRPIFSPNHLKTREVFTSVSRFVYLTRRAR